MTLICKMSLTVNYLIGGLHNEDTNVLMFRLHFHCVVGNFSPEYWFGSGKGVGHMEMTPIREEHAPMV